MISVPFEKEMLDQCLQEMSFLARSFLNGTACFGLGPFSGFARFGRGLGPRQLGRQLEGPILLEELLEQRLLGESDDIHAMASNRIERPIAPFVAMPGAPSRVLLFLVVRPGAP